MLYIVVNDKNNVNVFAINETETDILGLHGNRIYNID